MEDRFGTVRGNFEDGTVSVRSGLRRAVEIALLVGNQAGNGQKAVVTVSRSERIDNAFSAVRSKLEHRAATGREAIIACAAAVGCAVKVARRIPDQIRI